MSIDNFKEMDCCMRTLWMSVSPKWLAWQVSGV